MMMMRPACGAWEGRGWGWSTHKSTSGSAPSTTSSYLERGLHEGLGRLRELHTHVEARVQGRADLREKAREGEAGVARHRIESPAQPSHVDDEARVARLERAGACDELRPAHARRLEEARRSDAPEHLDGRARDERPARERRAVVPWGDARCDVLRHEHGADGQAVGERLGEGHDVGAEVLVRLVRPQAPAAPDARLHLVDDDQRACLIRGRTDVLEEGCARRESHA